MADTMTERLRDAIYSKAPKRLESLMKTASRECIQSITTNVSICTNNAQCLHILLNYIPNIDYIDVDPFRCNTMLTEAAKLGQLDCVRLLLERGANVNARNGNNETALMYACNDEHEEVFDLLIKWRSDIHVKACNGTAVGMAAHRNAVRCLHKLVSLGASIHELNCCDQTALSIACQCGHNDFVNALINYMDSCSEVNNSVGEENNVIRIHNIDSRDLKGKTSLMFSCEEGNAKLSEILLEHGADINAQDTKGRTALMYAAYNNNVQCFQLLLKEGANLDIVDNKGSTLFSSAVRGDGEILNVLLQTGIVLCDGVLKSQHRAGFFMSLSQERYFSFNFKSVLLLIAFGIFDWDWCFQSTVDPLDTFITPAIRSSICPGTMNYKGFEISVLPLAFVQVDAPTIKFLLAHRYFFPEDYAVLSTNTSFRNEIILDDSPFSYSSKDEVSKIWDQLILHPLSLQTWSFLTISKAVSLAGHPNKRTDRVDALPLPERVKRAFRFQTNVTELCSHAWDDISIDQAFDSLNFHKEISWEEDLKCGLEECLECGGSYYYYLFKAHQEC